jgi:hypothetical protein
MRRLSWLAPWSLTALAVACALYRSRPPARAPVFRPLSDHDARALYVAASDSELAARKKAVGRFRGSRWSQDDEFHNKEAHFVREWAASEHTTIGAVLDALDRGMHEGFRTAPNAVPDPRVIPCRPRLDY